MAEQPTVELLLVEDNAHEAHLLKTVLDRAEVRITWADTLTRALSELRERRFDVVLLDLNLPDSRGLSTFCRVHRAAPETAIVVTTLVDDHEVAINAVGQGAQDFIPKGVTDERLLMRSLRYAIERQRLLGSLKASRLDAELRTQQLADQYEELEGALGRLSAALDRERATARRRDELDRMKRELISIFAHDLRGPVGVIYGFVDLICERWTQLAEHKKLEYLRTIQRNAKNVERLIADVLETARVEEGALTFESRPFDLRGMLTSAVEHAAAAAERPTVTLDAPRGELVPAFGDEHRQWQVASNVIGNAIKFSPPGAPILVKLRRREGVYEVSVHDQGSGITKDEAARLFQKFSRLPRHGREGSTPVAGTGLGLFISRAIVEAQGGTIGVESTPGEGTTFVYTVPVDASARADQHGRAEGDRP